MKADRAAIGRAVDAPPPDLRLLLLHGPDEAGSRSLAQRYAQALGKGIETLDLNPAELRGDPARLVDEAAALSMFGGRTLIRVTGMGDESLTAVQALLDAPAAGNPVVATAGMLRRDSRLLKLCEGHRAALAFASYPPDIAEFEGITAALAREAGLDISRDLLRRVANAAGGDRAVVASEIDKLALYLDAGREQIRAVTPEDVAALSADIAESDIDRLIAGVTTGRLAEVDHQLTRLRGEGAAGISLLRSVGRRLHLLAELRQEVERGSDPQAVVASRGKAIFWKERDIVTTALRQWTSTGLGEALSRLLAAERAVKASGSAGDILVERALIDIARAAAARALR